MRRIVKIFPPLLGAAILAVMVGATERQPLPPQGDAPLWLFNFPDEEQPVQPQHPDVLTLEGSEVRYSIKDINIRHAPDWFPQDHMPMPAIVRDGNGGRHFACGSCHLASGMGHPESSALAGHPLGYFLRQLDDMARGDRLISKPPQFQAGRDGGQLMVQMARELDLEERYQAAVYFNTLSPVDWVKVVETIEVPRNYVTRGFLRLPHPDGGVEALGDRIVELPQSAEKTLKMAPYSGNIAYVPEGSVAAGIRAVRDFNCQRCHGADLRGHGDTPNIAGISPTLVARQLWYFRDGSRGNSPHSAAMRRVASAMSAEEILSVSAYLATLSPSRGSIR